MMEFLKNNVAIVASLASATIAASVALLVFALTQLVTARRRRAEVLVPKLELLYTTLNDVVTANARNCSLAVRAISGDKDALEKFVGKDELDIYGHLIAKQSIMYIRLYFPNLSNIHQLLFRLQDELNRLFYTVPSKSPPARADLLAAAVKIANVVRLFEREIIDNRDCLIGDRFLPRRFKSSSASDIEIALKPKQLSKEPEAQ